MFHQKSSNSTYRNIGWKKVVLCCSVSGLALFAAETAEAACNTTGTFTRTNCFSNGNIQYFSGEGASSLTLTGETASSVELKPDDSVTGATTQTLTIDGNTTLTRTDYSAVISQTNKANRNAIAVIETGATISASGGGFGAIWFKNDTSGDISISSGATVMSTGQATSSAAISATTNKGSVTIVNTGNVTSDDRGIYADGGYANTAQDPVVVSITNNGTVQANTAGARGINYHGNVTATNTGSIEANTRQGIVIWTADAGSASINNSGTVTAKDDHAIVAWSTNGDAIVTNSGTVTSSDDTNHTDTGGGHIGIQTQVETSGNTTITNMVSGIITATADTGIEAKALTAGNITISNAGSLSALRGIYAETADGTINISNTSTGTITANTDTGIEAKALTTGNITISNAGALSALRGIRAETADGTINITNTSTGIITANTDTGIEAKELKTGNITISNAGALTARRGIYAETAGNTTITNTSTGTITASADTGIEAKAVTAGNITISNAGSLSALRGIYAETADGTIGIANTGTLSATETTGTIYGIDYKNTGTVSGTISNSGVMTISNGTSSTGIMIEAGSGVSVENTGTLSVSTTARAGGIVTTGTVTGTIKNSGNLTVAGNASGAGIFIDGGSNVSVENSGTLSVSSMSSAVGIATTTTGSIAQLTNSGTISATQYAIQNAGTMQSNSTIYGVLSGYTSDSSMVKGQITHTNADLTFSSGKIWLNDDINATGHSVKNTGATLKLSNAVTITGNYVQTGGGLLVEATNTSSHGALNVSGDAAISNSTVVVSGNNLAVGDSYTIVGAGGTGSYTTLSASVVGTADRNAVVKTVGKDLVVILTKADGTGKYTPVGNAEGGSATPLGRTLDTINAKDTPAAIAFQNQVLAQIDSLPEAQRGTAIKELSPASAANTVQLSAQATSIVIGAVETRQQIAMSGDGASQTGIAAGDEARYSQLWGQILGGSAHRAGDSENDGFTSKSFGLTSGFDHLITPNLLGGVALSWVRSWTDGSNASNGSTNTLDSYQMTFYGTYHIDRLAIDGQIGAGWNHYDQQRTISFLGNTASADYDGQQYMARTRVGYDFSLGDTTLTPFAGLRWLGARTESYQETGAGAANNSVNSQNNSSVTHEVGARAEWSFDTPTGIVSPEVSAAWIHDYTDNTVDTTGQIGGTDYSIQTKGLESDGVRLGIGLSYQTYENLSLKLSYDGELRSGYQSQAATLRMNLDF
jgi:outer membrane autotransporter protein